MSHPIFRRFDARVVPQTPTSVPGVTRSVWRTSAHAIAIAITCASVLAGCSGGGDTPSGPGAATRMDVSASTVSLTTIGGSQSVTATPRDANGAALSAAGVVWTSDNSAIATVGGSGSSGTIVAVGPGSTIVHARLGSIGADITVQVLGVRAIQVNPSSASIRAGDSQTLSATFDADAGVSTAVTWTSGTVSVATVSAAGVVTGVTPGTAVIRATSVADPRISATGTVTVTPARSVTITPGSANLATAETRTLQAAVLIEAGQSTAVTWRSSAVAVATVTSTGIVRGVAFGTATITAVSVADTLLRGTATINVVPVIRSVAVAPLTASGFIGDKQQFTATVVAEGTLSPTVTWRSNNPAVASVNATGTVTAVALGSASITAVSTVDTTKTASAVFVVTPRPISVAIVQRLVSLNPGTNTTLTANVIADPGISTAVTWTSTAPTVASISGTGVVSAVTAGSALVTVTSQADPSKRDTVTVTVVPRLATSWSSSRMNGVMYDDMISVVGFNPTTAFAINSVNGGISGGDIYRWNGVTWALSTTGAAFGTQFLAVHGTSVSNLIAVGTNGVVAKFDGTTWSTMASGTTRTLRSVWVESATSAFAVGTNGTAIRLTGTTWATMTTGSTAQLNGVWSNAGIAYAVGAGGEVLRFNGTAWARQTVPFTDDLNAVCGIPGGSVTVVGNFGGILNFNGTTWTLVNPNGIIDNFYAVNGNSTSGGRMNIGGDNGLYALDFGTLTVANISYPVSVYGVSVDEFGEVWTAGQRGAVQRLASGTWQTLNLAPDLLDVWTTSASNAYAVGEYGFIYRWNGSAWSRQTSPSLANLYTVWGVSTTDAFAGGDNGTMLRWNGTAWNAMSLPTTARIFSLWGTSASNVFAVTDVGEILRFNGTTWSVQATAPGGATLLSVHGVSPTEAYATGTSGVVMRYNGTTWTTTTAPDAVTSIFGIWMSGSNNMLAVGQDQSGASGFAFSFNGTAWQSMALSGAKGLTSVWGPSIFDVYATGDAGTLLRYNGVNWQSVSTGTTDLLWSVSGAPDATGGAFAVGINGTMVAGLSSGAVRASAIMAASSVGNLEPSASARHDRKASGKAATGAARRDRAIRGSVGAMRAAAGRAAVKGAAARAAARRGR